MATAHFFADRETEFQGGEDLSKDILSDNAAHGYKLDCVLGT